MRMMALTCITLLSVLHLSISGQVEPKQVAFSATKNEHQMPKYGGQIARFDVVDVNIGDGYSVESGIFNAPVRGTYVFNISALKYLKGNKEFIRLRHNGRDVVSLYSDSAGNGQNISHTVLLHLEREDQVYVYLDTNNESEEDCGLNGNGYSSFSGYLLYETY